MNEETLVVNLFLTVRVFLVGTILLLFPRISRKGLLFGTYIGEALADDEAARRVRRGWDLGCALIMALALMVGYSISLAGRPVVGNLTGTAVLLLSFPILYTRVYFKARALAPPAESRPAPVAAAPLTVDESQGDGFARLTLGLCLLIGIATAAWVTHRYEALPDRLATLGNIFDLNDEMVDKSVVAALVVPSLGLVLSASFALMGLLMVRAKRSVRGGSGGRSAEAQLAFRRAMAQVISGTALFTVLLMAVLAVQMMRIWSGQATSIGPAIGWPCAAFIVYALANLVRLFRYGQGGARLEEGSVEAPLTGGLADNAHWILGVIYVDKDDPSILVEDRFGIGYTVNFGNRSALLLMGTLVVLILGLIVLAATAVA